MKLSIITILVLSVCACGGAITESVSGDVPDAGSSAYPGPQGSGSSPDDGGVWFDGCDEECQTHLPDDPWRTDRCFANACYGESPHSNPATPWQ